MPDHHPTDVTAAAPTRRDSPYAWFVVSLLMVTSAVSFVDRQLLNLLIEPIKHDLHASDTQLGFLQGAAFIVAYLAFGPFCGRLADKGDRRNLLVAAVVLWSSATILCGLAVNLPMLFASRAGVGAAEAALGPAAASLIADYFTKERLPRALSINILGAYVGGGLALVFGGLAVGSARAISAAVPAFSHLAAWQTAFITVGAPGLFLALLLLVIREPARRSFVVTDDHPTEQVYGLGDAVRFLWASRSFYGRYMGAMTLLTLVLYAVPAWMPSLMIRTFGMAPKQVGLAYGATTLVMGVLGALSGPTLNTLLRRRWPNTSMMLCVALPAFAIAATLPLIALAKTFPQALAVAAAVTYFYTLPQAVAVSALLIATPNRMRGIMGGLYVMCASGIGLGLGPALVALVTDKVFGDPHAIVLSLPLVGATAAIGAGLLALGSLPYVAAILTKATPATPQ